MARKRISKYAVERLDPVKVYWMTRNNEDVYVVAPPDLTFQEREYRSVNGAEAFAQHLVKNYRAMGCETTVDYVGGRIDYYC